MRRSLAMFVVLAFVVVSAMFERPAAAQEPEPGILDEVAATLRQASPGTEGTVWRDTTGNRLPGAASDWLLQTPRCWGTIACPDQVGTRKLLQTLTDEIAAARVSVTITTLWPFADGGFETAIVEGLRRSLAAGNRPLVRWLGGSPFFYSYTGQGPDALRDKILADLGPVGAQLPIVVATMTTALQSWNHAKIVAVDGRRAIVGGHNMWAVDYLSPTPVSDLSMLAAGPAAEAANGFADILWNYVCDRQAQGFLSQLLWIRYSASGPVGGCPRTTPVRPPGTPGSTRILVVGRLGQGIAIPGTLGSPISDLIQLLCPGFREDRADEARNPGLVAGRALIAAADERLFISQQDLLAMCPRSDPKTMAAIAGRIAAGVDTTIVVTGAFGTSYANMDSLFNLSEALFFVLNDQLDDPARAASLMCANLHLASVQIGPDATWPNGKGFANHAKFIAVDDEVFKIGSNNLYPASLQELDFIVDDRAALAQVRRIYLDPLWEWSRRDAIIDPDQGRCQIFGG